MFFTNYTPFDKGICMECGKILIDEKDFGPDKPENEFAIRSEEFTESLCYCCCNQLKNEIGYPINKNVKGESKYEGIK